jgi:hypothetical protein
MCKGSTSTTTQAPSSQAMAAYEQIMQQAQGVAATPYQPYTGQLVAQFTPEQITALNNINQYATSAQPAYAVAGQMAAEAGQPITAADIQQYVNPWTSGVVGATEAEFANTLGMNLNATKGNAISSGAFGGNREGVAEGITSGQVATQEAPVLASLESQGYTQGVNTALSQQQAKLAAAYGLSSVAGAGQQSALTGAQAQFGVGSAAQTTEQAQLNAAYQQYLNAMGYPFQTTGWEAGVAGGIGSLMGGTGTTTTPYTAQQLIGQLGGATTSSIGILGGTGAFGTTGYLNPSSSNSIWNFAHGGAVAALARGGGVSADGVANRTPTVPEAPRTLHAQQRHMVEGHRRAMLFPHGTREIPVAPGMRRTEVNGEVYHYNPRMTHEAEVHGLARAGREHELLGLGPFSKQEVLHRIAGGEVPAAVVERDRDGTEVRGTVGTHVTAPHQWRHFHRTKVPGNTVHIENPEHTLAIRHHHHRADGGMVPGYDLGGATPQAAGVASPNYAIAAPITFSGSPWSGSKLPVPQTQIPHGSLPSPPKQPQQQQQTPSSTNQAQQVGELAKAIQKGMNSPATGVTPAAAGVGAVQTPSGVADVIGSDAALYRRGGRVPQYAEGGGDDDAIYVPPDMPAAAPLNFVSGMPSNGVASDDDTLNQVAARASTHPRDVGPPLALVAPSDGVAPATAGLPPEIAHGNSLKPADRDAAIRTIYGEAADQGPNGQAAVANVIRNRVLDGSYGKSASDVVHAPNQFEPWNTAAGRARMNSMTPEEYESIGNIVDNVWGGKIKDQTGGATHFYAPGAQAALGRNAPNWDDGTGLKIGDHLFFKPGDGAPGTRAMALRASGDEGGDMSAAAYRGVGSGAGAFRPAGRGGIKPDAAGVAPGIDFSQNSKLWPALIMAGGSMMAASRPGTTLGEAVGHGVVSGAQTYEGLKQQEQAAAMNEKKINLESQKLAEELNYHRSHLDIMTKEANTKEAAEKSLADWRQRMNLKPSGRMTLDDHPILTDAYGRGGSFDGITMQPLDPGAETKPVKQNWKSSGYVIDGGPHDGDLIAFDTTGGSRVARDAMTGEQLDMSAIRTRPAAKAPGAMESLANRLMEENRKQRETDPSMPEMTFEQALALAHRAPNEDQNTIKLLNLAERDWANWNNNPANMAAARKGAPESTLDYWEQRYGVSPRSVHSPAPAPGTPAPAASPPTPAPAGTGTPPTARPAPTPSAAPTLPPGVPPGSEHYQSNKGKERWVSPPTAAAPKGNAYVPDGKGGWVNSGPVP